MDATLSSPMTDLKRGPLGDTLLVYAGEFGPIPNFHVEVWFERGRWRASRAATTTGSWPCTWRT
jgi:hypothetical protein